MKRICIVGSGLSAFATYIALKEKYGNSVEIVIIDSHKKETTETVTKISAAKGLFGSLHMYDFSDSNLKFKEPSNYSMAFGGFSTVWGAGIRFWDKEDIKGLSKLNSKDIYESGMNLLENIPYSASDFSINIPEEYKFQSTHPPMGATSFDKLLENEVKKINVFRTPLAVDVLSKNKCIGCGDCLIGCRSNSIFNTVRYFENEMREGKVRLIKGIVLKISNKEKVNIEYKTEKSLEETDFDLAYLCAGAVGTASILMQSDLLGNEINILDSQVFYFIGITRFPQVNGKRFALSQITVASSMASKYPFSLSLYQCDDKIRERLALEISKHFFGIKLRIPKFIDKYLFVGIGFLDSEHSGEIKLTKRQNEVFVSSVPNKVSKKIARKVLHEANLQTKTNGFHICSRIVSLPKPGQGFHSGGSLPLGSQFVDNYGHFRKGSLIRVADTSLLRYIRPGAHTFMSMCLNHAIIKNQPDEEQ